MSVSIHNGPIGRRREGYWKAPGLSDLGITREITGLLAAIDGFSSTWDLLELLQPAQLATMRGWASIESIGASIRLGGRKFADWQAEDLLDEFQSKTSFTRAEREAAGYVRAMERVAREWPEMQLDEDYIRLLHQDLLWYGVGSQRRSGGYAAPGDVTAAGSADSLLFPSYFLQELADWAEDNMATRRLHPLLTIAVFVATFLEIRPFREGNDRLSRVLTTWLLLRAGYSYAPYCSLEHIIESNKKGYDWALLQVRTSTRNGSTDWQPWLQFFLKALFHQVWMISWKIEKSA